MHIAPDCSNFFLFLFCIIASSFLVQIGEAAAGDANHKNKQHIADRKDAHSHVDHHQQQKEEDAVEVSKSPKLEFLSGKEAKFYASLVVPMVDKCADKQFAKGLDTFELREKGLLCASVENLKDQFVELNSLNESESKGKPVGYARKRASRSQMLEGEPINFYQQIHKVITEDLFYFKDKYFYKLNSAGVVNVISDTIEDGVATGKHLRRKFKQTFDAFKRYLRMWAMDTALKRDTVENKKVVYKLLCICHQMDMITFDNDEKELLWSFRQFAINLAIYFIGLDKLPPQANSALGEKGEIQTIPKKWPIEIIIEIVEHPAAQLMTETLTGIHEDFYKSLVMPMMGKCADREFGTDILHDQKEKLCGHVKNVAELFAKLNEKLKTAPKGNCDEKEINLILKEIRHAIFGHAMELSENLRQLFGRKYSEFEEIGADKNLANLNTLEATFDQMFVEMHKEKTHLKTAITDQKKDRIGSQKVAFKLLFIGSQMRSLFNADVEDELEQLQELAYQQFAINLAVHSIHLDSTNSSAYIQTIAKEWPIGMETNELQKSGVKAKVAEIY